MSSILQGKKAQKAIIGGINIMCNAVKSTAGAEGAFVAIQGHSLTPHFSSDGKTVAQAVRLENKFEAMAAQTAYEACKKTAEESGDASTVTCIFIQAMVNEGFKLLKTNSLFDLKIGMQAAHAEMVKYLLDNSKSVKTDKDVQNIATISVNNDPIVGKLIADAYKKVGRDGLIKADIADKTELVFEEGMRMESGFFHPLFINNPKRKAAELKNCNILVIDGQLVDASEVREVIAATLEASKPLLIITEDVDDELLSLLIAEKLKSDDEPGFAKVYVAKAPSYGEKRKQFLKDVALYTEAEVWNKNFSDSYRLGHADNVTITEEFTIFKTELSEDTKNKIAEIQDKERVAALKNNVATIYVGGTLESDRGELKDRVDDAIHAVRSSFEQGYVAGGGTSYIHAAQMMFTDFENKSQDAGYELYKSAVRAHFRTLLENAGADAEKYFTQVEKSVPGTGYNLRTRKIENMFKSGIVDPTKVQISALTNALAASMTLLSTKTLIAQ